MASGPGVELFVPSEAALHSSKLTNTIRVGSKLHIAVVTISLQEPPSSPPPPLMPGQLYSYNLVFKVAGATSDLKSLALLQDKFPNLPNDPIPHLALGYNAGMLPSFVLPPVTIDKLNLVHGSCRKAHGPGKDSLAALDNIIKKAVTDNDPEKRPHQLFLTGDQIYADEVPTVLLPRINALGSELLGVKENVSVKKASGPTEDAEASMANFPASRRMRICNKNAMFTSVAAENHLLSFGEFAATYLMYWNNAVWAKELFDSDELEKDDSYLTTWDTDPLTAMEQQLCPLDADEQKKRAAETPAQKQKRIDETKKAVKDAYLNELKEVSNFRNQLPQVRRALANVPVYMIMDDHEVTDDWYITKNWRDKVLTSPLGLSILRNGLMAYTLFQDWGNVPEQYDSAVAVSPKTELLTQIQQIIPASGAAPATATADAMHISFGFNLPDETPPPVKWHFTVPCSETSIYVLDTRTRRTYETRYSPPGLLSNSAMDDQIPLAAQPEKFLIFVSPAPVLGLGTLEELLQPAMTAFNDFEADPEAWAFSPPVFEDFLSRMEKFKRVVFLSGDVHFGCGGIMDYWKKGEPKAARFIQFVSSGLKNQKFGSEQFLIGGLVQKLLGSLFYPGRRLGWQSKLGLQLTNPGGKANPPKHRVRLRKEPVLLPTEGWPAGTTANKEPDWKWLLNIMKDERPDNTSADARPTKVQVKSIIPDVNPLSNAADAYDKVLTRHMEVFKKNLGRTVVWDSNIGLIKFKTDGAGIITASQQTLYWLNTDEITDDPETFTAFAAILEPGLTTPPVLG